MEGVAGAPPFVCPCAVGPPHGSCVSACRRITDSTQRSEMSTNKRPGASPCREPRRGQVDRASADNEPDRGLATTDAADASYRTAWRRTWDALLDHYPGRPADADHPSPPPRACRPSWSWHLPCAPASCVVWAAGAGGSVSVSVVVSVGVGYIFVPTLGVRKRRRVLRSA